MVRESSSHVLEHGTHRHRQGRGFRRANGVSDERPMKILVTVVTRYDQIAFAVAEARRDREGQPRIATSRRDAVVPPITPRSAQSNIYYRNWLRARCSEPPDAGVSLMFAFAPNSNAQDGSAPPAVRHPRRQSIVDAVSCVLGEGCIWKRAQRECVCGALRPIDQRRCLGRMILIGAPHFRRVRVCGTLPR
jgi:hypothetical protein